ncbi:dockerin type I domain-containing protein [Paenibacillus thiaminolyticus]
MVASHYGKTKHSPDWEQVKHMDANGNGKIDDQDLAFVSRKLMN